MGRRDTPANHFLQIGKVAHVAADLVLVSAFLAGVKRSTGITPNLNMIDSPEIRKYSQKYLGIGESFFDWTSAYMSSSDYFTRK